MIGFFHEFCTPYLSGCALPTLKSDKIAQNILPILNAPLRTDILTNPLPSE